MRQPFEQQDYLNRNLVQIHLTVVKRKRFGGKAKNKKSFKITFVRDDCRFRNGHCLSFVCSDEMCLQVVEICERFETNVADQIRNF